MCGRNELRYGTARLHEDLEGTWNGRVGVGMEKTGWGRHILQKMEAVTHPPSHSPSLVRSDSVLGRNPRKGLMRMGPPSWGAGAAVEAGLGSRGGALGNLS